MIVTAESGTTTVPSEDEQRTVTAQSVIFGTPSGNNKTNLSHTSACMIIVTVRSSQVMCNHVLSQLLWKAPTSSARLKLARGSSVWPINFTLDLSYTV